MAPDVSVCIATCNRPRGLTLLLASLARQKLPPGCRIEVLVVDNDPSGSAADVASGIHDFPHPLRWLSEPRRNIARARNCALAAASGRWLAFIDDDEVAAEDWLARLLACAEAGNADGWFGPVLPQPEDPAAGWSGLAPHFEHPRHPTGSSVPGAELRTGNALVRRTLLPEAAFDPAFGLSGGSDSELFGRLGASGARFCWCDEAVVTEFVPRERQRLRWLARRRFRGGFVHTRLALRRHGRCAVLAAALPRAGVGLLACGLAWPLARIAGRAPATRVLLRGCVQAGHLWALCGRGYHEYGGR